MDSGTINKPLIKEDKEAKKRYYQVFAYPTVSGMLHVGHARSYTLPDIIARFMKMKGEDVYFPVGFHATGIDNIELVKKLKKNPDIARNYGLKPEEVSSFTEPIQLEKFIEQKYIDSFKKLNLELDYDSTVATIDPHYNKFIQWQFRKLKDAGYLKKQPYRLPWCTSCGNAVSLDDAAADISQGSESRIADYSMLKFRSENNNQDIFVAATLRPETIYGVTNMWFNPDGNYVRCKVDDETWIISHGIIDQLSGFGKKVEIIEPVNTKSLEDLILENPINKSKLPLIPASFVGTETGTGIVMSVPAHDPHDYFYLRESRPDIAEKIFAIIDLHGYNVPAREIIEPMLRDKKFSEISDEELDAIKKKLYRMENTGTMNSHNGPYVGMRAQVAREKIKNDMMANNALEIISELTSPAKCRCGTDIIVRKIEDQWFIDYSNLEWKEKTKKAISMLTTAPPEYKDELPLIIDWLKERPCIRRNGMGTEFPFEDGWIIEPLADSTIYMSFFPIARKINRNELSLENLNDDFFDYVLLGKGNVEQVAKTTSISIDKLTEIKQEFDNTYPLDYNMGGIEHKQVHFPFFLFAHTAIFPEHKWPKGISLNWHVIVEGEKMSKSKGNVVFWDDAVDKYSADGVRLYVSHGQTEWKDFDWKHNMAFSYSKKIESFKREIIQTTETIEQIIKGEYKSNDSDTTNNAGQEIDTWFESITNHYISDAKTNLENFRIRKAINSVFFEMKNDISWYLKRGGKNPNLLKNAIQAQVQMLYPVIPEITSDLYNILNQDNTTMSWPETDSSKINNRAEELELSLRDLYVKVNSNIMNSKRRSVPKELHIFTYNQEEKEYLEREASFIIKNTPLENVTIYSRDSQVEPEFVSTAKRSAWCIPSFRLK
jgi:leucyl-tRNA synthetase